MKAARCAWLALAAIALLAIGSASAQKSAVTVVLGDSLSDDGNFYIEFTGRKYPNASYGYFEGAFTNAPGVWATQLSAVNASTISTRNFAFAGATACTYPELKATFPPPLNELPSVKKQVDRFKAKLEEPAFNASLIGGGGRLISAFLWGGHNDLIRVARLLPPAQQATLPNRISACINQAARSLLASQGDVFDGLVISNLAPIANTPLGSALGADANGQLTAAVRAVNANLAAVVDKLKADYPDKKIALYDAYGVISGVIANATSLGFTEPIEEPCLQFAPDGNAANGDAPRSECDNPDQKVFFDQLHPSAAGHKILADSIGEFMIAEELAKPLATPTPAGGARKLLRGL